MNTKKIQIGGQALPNGVMMRSVRFISRARRMPDGSISTSIERVKTKATRHRYLSLPFVRGPVGIADTIWNTSLKAMSKKTLVLVVSAMVMVDFAFILLYKQLFPAVATVVGNGVSLGVTTIAVYVLLLALMLLHPRVRRLLQYHGAEHQCIYAFESDSLITPEAASRFPLAHPRCGTNLFAMYLLSTSAIAPLLPAMGIVASAIVQLLLMIPLISVWYEVIMLTNSNRWGNWARTALIPGMWFQLLTVQRPNQKQLEVACAAVKAVVEAESKEDSSSSSNLAIWKPA